MPSNRGVEHVGERFFSVVAAHLLEKLVEKLLLDYQVWRDLVVVVIVVLIIGISFQRRRDVVVIVVEVVVATTRGRAETRPARLRIATAWQVARQRGHGPLWGQAADVPEWHIHTFVVVRHSNTDHITHHPRHDCRLKVALVTRSLYKLKDILT